MVAELSGDLKVIVPEICNQLVFSHKLITTKNVTSILSELYPNINCYTEESVNQNINIWRLSQLESQNLEKINNHLININQPVEPIDEILINQLQEDNNRYKKQLNIAKRELQLLKAKIQALNGLHNRQRKELIMKIEGMLYK